MYYISKEHDVVCSAVVKTLKQFASHSLSNEGDRFWVRTKREIEEWDHIPIYVMKNGRLKSAKQTAIIWSP